MRGTILAAIAALGLVYLAFFGPAPDAKAARREVRGWIVPVTRSPEMHSSSVRWDRVLPAIRAEVADVKTCGCPWTAECGDCCSVEHCKCAKNPSR